MLNHLSLKSLALVAALAATPVFAHHAGDVFQAGDMRAGHAWTQETAGMSNSIEIFVTLTNAGTEADRLVGATTDFSSSGVFQAPVLGSDGALTVTEVPAIEIAPGQDVTLQPGGIRIVLANVQEDFHVGEHFHMTLEFETAGELEIDVAVDDRAGEDDHDGDDHDHRDDDDHDHDA